MTTFHGLGLHRESQTGKTSRLSCVRHQAWTDGCNKTARTEYNDFDSWASGAFSSLCFWLPSVAFFFFTDSDTVAHWHLNKNIYTGFLPDDLGVGVGVKGKEVNYI